MPHSEINQTKNCPLLQYNRGPIMRQGGQMLQQVNKGYNKRLNWAVPHSEPNTKQKKCPPQNSHTAAVYVASRNFFTVFWSDDEIKKEKICENGGPLTLFPVNHRNGNQLQRRRSYQNLSKLNTFHLSFVNIQVSSSPNEYHLINNKVKSTILLYIMAYFAKEVVQCWVYCAQFICIYLYQQILYNR